MSLKARGIAGLCIVLFANLFFRCLIGQLSYSGEATPPKFGDFEAQRHWLEITYHLPAADWYRQTADNDLQWWGLDYPPLTAYLSLVFAEAAALVFPPVDSSASSPGPAMLQLGVSRGFESPESKLFMRMTVLIADVLIYWTGAYAFLRLISPSISAAIAKADGKRGEAEGEGEAANEYKASGQINWDLFFMLFCPPLLLIDHGHFQYNAVALGLALWAVVLIAKGHTLLGSIAYCLALNFKQIAAYYALAFFFYLLRSSWEAARKPWSETITLVRHCSRFVWQVLGLGVVVILTFLVLWSPFNPFDVLDRLIPVARGVFEDKVANFWCTISVLFKVHVLLDKSLLFILCLALTLLSVLPSCIHCLFHPSSPRKLALTLANCSLGFFLFSYQVHEKSILFPVLPVLLFAIATQDLSFATWFLTVASFSMYPLLIRDGHAASYFATQLVLVFFFFSWRERGWLPLFYKLSFIAMMLIHAAGFLIEPPQRWPDLLAVTISIVSFSQFAFAFLYLHAQQFGLVRVVEGKDHSN